MKLVFYNDFVLGVLKDGNVHDVSNAVKDVPRVTPQDLIQGVISSFDTLRNAIESEVTRSQGIPVSQVRLRSPLPRPTHIIAMAVNYMEFGARAEPAPINAFIKSSEAVIGNGDTIVLSNAPATIFHHEAELGVVIGKPARNVSANDAYSYIFGYVNTIDASARGLGNGSFYQGKSWDTLAPIGPCIVTADEIDDPMKLPVRLSVNGTLRQDFNTDDMAHNIQRCIEWVTAVTALEPGDVILTGTNHQGLGAMQDGDTIEIEIEGLERLTVHVSDPQKREWPTGIDQATADRVAGRTTTGGFGEPART
ncbi:MAG: fumarylacetoacetate hydrolase family protein [Chloroflexota bacterium]|nr:fumarylacetoacetate hydrolase family protein [Chloroflexota bacterium]